MVDLLVFVLISIYIIIIVSYGVFDNWDVILEGGDLQIIILRFQWFRHHPRNSDQTAICLSNNRLLMPWLHKLIEMLLWFTFTFMVVVVGLFFFPKNLSLFEISTWFVDKAVQI